MGLLPAWRLACHLPLVLTPGPAWRREGTVEEDTEGLRSWPSHPGRPRPSSTPLPKGQGGWGSHEGALQLRLFRLGKRAERNTRKPLFTLFSKGPHFSALYNASRRGDEGRGGMERRGAALGTGGGSLGRPGRKPDLARASDAEGHVGVDSFLALKVNQKRRGAGDGGGAESSCAGWWEAAVICWRWLSGGGRFRVWIPGVLRTGFRAHR